MTKEEYLKELEVLKDFAFYESDHHYEYKGKRVGISVTKLIEDYVQPFNEEEVASRVAEKNGKSIEEILEQWKTTNEQSCLKGSICHENVQNMFSGTNILFDDKNLSEATKIALQRIFQQEKDFYENFKDKFELVANEYVIGSKDNEYDIASAVDSLFINKLTGGLVMIDYKTNTDMYKTEKYYKSQKKQIPKMKVPLHKLDDTKITHYAIQLSIYKYLLEKYTNLKLEDMFIVWFSELNDNYQIIEIPYLKNEVEMILERRRQRNFMENKKSVVILVIGKSGAGKSASLRNFKNDEVGIINVLGKELPFKNNFKYLVTDNYDKIFTAANTSKKKTIVIDDANYLITREFVRTATQTGYQKFTNMAVNNDILVEGKYDTNGNKIKSGLKDVEGGKTIYLFWHEDVDEDGNIKPKTIGKMVDEKINFQGLFTIVIRVVNDNGNYKFLLKSNGQDCVKTPIGMFESSEMPNDLKEFDKVVREYYELDKEENEEAE